MNDTSTAGADVNADLREITSPAGKLRYYDIGNGPALLFLHGSGPGVTGWRNFRGVLPAFAKQFRCLMLEFPGFGVSDDFGGHPMIDAQASVAPFLDAIGVDSRRHHRKLDGWRGRHQFRDPPAERGAANSSPSAGSARTSSGRGLVRACGCCRVHRGPHPPAARRLAQLDGLHPATRDRRTVEERWELATDPRRWLPRGGCTARRHSRR